MGEAAGDVVASAAHLPQTLPAERSQTARASHRRRPSGCSKARSTRAVSQTAAPSLRPSGGASHWSVSRRSSRAARSSARWCGSPRDRLPASCLAPRGHAPGCHRAEHDWNDRDLAITPDGSRVVYVGNRGTQLFVRALDALAPVAVFTGTPRGLFVSPDGQWIGFSDGRGVLKKVAVTGGPAVTLATFEATVPCGRRGDRTTRSSSQPPAPLPACCGSQRPAGRSTVVTRPDREQGEADHFWPEMLPGGRGVLFTITALTGGLDAAQVAVLDLQTGIRRVLVRGGSHAHYVPSGRRADGGHLVYAAAGTLRAVPFDLARLETRGPSVTVVPDVVMTGNGGVDAVVSAMARWLMCRGTRRGRSARSCG